MRHMQNQAQESREKLIAWAAGFFDGEGCITISKERGSSVGPYYRLRIKVSQVRRNPLDTLSSLFGGKVTGPVKVASVHNYASQDQYRWELSGDNACSALHEMSPHFQVKFDQAMLALKFQSAVHINKRLPDEVASKEAAYIEMKKLKKAIQEYN